MTEQSFPITPPPELIEQWKNLPEYTDGKRKMIMVTLSREKLQEIATQAANWGADRELDECCKWLPKLPPWSADDLHKHRRPKPPSLKKQALAALNIIEDKMLGPTTEEKLIRRALEALDD